MRHSRAGARAVAPSGPRLFSLCVCVCVRARARPEGGREVVNQIRMDSMGSECAGGRSGRRAVRRRAADAALRKGRGRGEAGHPAGRAGPGRSGPVRSGPVRFGRWDGGKRMRYLESSWRRKGRRAPVRRKRAGDGRGTAAIVRAGPGPVQSSGPGRAGIRTDADARRERSVRRRAPLQCQNAGRRGARGTGGSGPGRRAREVEREKEREG